MFLLGKCKSTVDVGRDIIIDFDDNNSFFKHSHLFPLFQNKNEGLHHPTRNIGMTGLILELK